MFYLQLNSSKAVTKAVVVIINNLLYYFLNAHFCFD